MNRWLKIAGATLLLFVVAMSAYLTGYSHAKKTPSFDVFNAWEKSTDGWVAEIRKRRAIEDKLEALEREFTKVTGKKP